MEKEGNVTTLLMRDPNPASGGPADWYIRRGNFIPLAEIFWKGIDLASAFDTYMLYTSLPVFTNRRMHIMSHTGGATRRRNARALQYQETGKWGFPPAPLARTRCKGGRGGEEIVESQPLVGPASSSEFASRRLRTC